MQTAATAATVSRPAAITPEQVALVQSSFAMVVPIADTAGVLLYERIFALAPGSRSLFDADIRPQAARLMTAFGKAVEGLHQPETIVPFLVRLGARHRRYGVRAEHFGVVGAALLWTLEQGLGDEFTPELRDAWSAAWDVIAA